MVIEKNKQPQNNKKPHKQKKPTKQKPPKPPQTKKLSSYSLNFVITQIYASTHLSSVFFFQKELIAADRL